MARGRMTGLRDASADWEQYGRRDPYHAVLSDGYRVEDLDAEARATFFASGEQHVAQLERRVRAHLDPHFVPGRALDFGCGVGRLLIPLASRADSVVGVDVAPSMLAEARRNCEAAGHGNVELIAPAAMSGLAPDFDLVHSVITLQHIPIAEGMAFVQRLAGLVAPGGIAALHVSLRPVTRRGLAYFTVMRRVPYAHNLWNLRRRRPWNYPQMQMNRYDLPRVLRVLEQGGLAPATVWLWRDQGSMPFETAWILARRASRLA